jgi:hypothetical protein
VGVLTPDKADIERINEKISRVFRLTCERVLSRIAINAAGHMIVPGGMGKPSDKTKLTTRTARLLRSIVGARGQEWGGKESIRKVRITKTKFEAEAGTKVPYAPAHEFGTPARTDLVTSKQRKFFWAMFFKTNEPKWKGAALSKGIHRKTYGGRPFLAPAMVETAKDADMVFVESMREVFR